MEQYNDASHADVVNKILAQVRSRPSDKILAVAKATRSHTPHTKGYKTGAHLVDVSALTRILRVDPINRTVTAEGQVSMRQLAEETLRYGLAIPVVPELSPFTVAGLINGLGIQSSSHRYGLFPDNLVSFEAVAADGRRVVASADNEHKDLFHNLPGSYGSLGIVTAATLKLIPAGPFVRCRYWHYNDLSTFQAAVEEATGQAKGHGRAQGPVPTFVEGFVFSAASAVLVCSEYSQHPGGRNDVFYATVRGEPWYHQHVLTMANRAGQQQGNGGQDDSLPTLGRPYAEDALPSIDYLFRLERGYWWVVDHIVGLRGLTSPTGTGAALGIDHGLRTAVDAAVAADVRKLPTGVGSWAGQSLNPGWTPHHMHRCMVHQDMGVRLGRMQATIQYTIDHVGVYPIWVCPFRVVTRKGSLWNAGWDKIARENSAAGLGPAAGPMPGPGPEVEEGFPLMAVDVGLYGEPTVAGFKARSTIRALQTYVDVPAFWGMSYLTQAELEAVYDFPTYKAVRRAYGAEGTAGGKPGFPDIRNKTTFWDPSEPDLPPLFAWRFHRAGIFWQTVAGAGAVGLASAAGIAAYLGLLPDVKHAKAALPWLSSLVGGRS